MKLSISMSAVCAGIGILLNPKILLLNELSKPSSRRRRENELLT
jgi:hypothetical protein